MGYRVKSFREVKQDSSVWRHTLIDLAQSCMVVINWVSQEKTLSKAMLLVDNDVIFRQVFGHMTEHNVLHYFIEVKEIGR